VPGGTASVPVLAARRGRLFGIPYGQVRWQALPGLRLGSHGRGFRELKAIFECQVVQNLSYDRGREFEA
jgi:hypothetical protein